MASTVFLQKRAAFTKKLLTLALVAARTWRFATVLQIPWYMSLHFCDYNAMAMSFLWAVLDVLTIVVIGVGQASADCLAVISRAPIYAD